MSSLYFPHVNFDYRLDPPMAEPDCDDCLDGHVVSDICDDCDTRHCPSCEPCLEDVP